jgi:hypothetical protein
MALAAAVLGDSAAELPAQQVTVTAPFHAVNDSFFEQIGTNWGFNANGINFRFGSPNMAAPQFGHFDPGAGLSTGFTFGRPGGPNGFFNLTAGQGFRQSLMTQAPVLTLSNGLPGFVSDTSMTPFVISYVPVVGGFPSVGFLQPVLPPPYPLSGPIGAPATSSPRIEAMRQLLAERKQAEEGPLPDPPAIKARAEQPAPDLRQPPAPQAKARNAVPPGPAAARGAEESAAGVGDRLAAAQESSAGRAVPGVALARQLHQQEQAARDQELQAIYQRGLMAEEDGKPRLAKVYYEMVLRRGRGELKAQAEARLTAMRAESKP